MEIGSDNSEAFQAVIVPTRMSQLLTKHLGSSAVITKLSFENDEFSDDQFLISVAARSIQDEATGVILFVGIPSGNIEGGRGPYNFHSKGRINYSTLKETTDEITDYGGLPIIQDLVKIAHQIPDKDVKIISAE